MILTRRLDRGQNRNNAEVERCFGPPVCDCATIVEPRRKVPEVTRPLPYSPSFNGLLNHRRLADLHLGGVAKRIHFTVVGAHPDFRS